MPNSPPRILVAGLILTEFLCSQLKDFFFYETLAARTEIDPKYLKYTDLKDQRYMCRTCRVVGGMHGARACQVSCFNALPFTVSILQIYLLILHPNLLL